MLNEKMNHAFRVVITMIVIFTIADTFIMPRLTTRFCYNSSDPNRVSSQCILCNYFLFDSTVLGCTGSSALTVNITAEQAFCVISQCLGQIRQVPMFLGRRRRSVDESESLQKDNTIGAFNRDEDSDSIIDVEPIDDDDGQVESADKDGKWPTIEQNIDGVVQKFIGRKEVSTQVVDIPQYDLD